MWRLCVYVSPSKALHWKGKGDCISLSCMVTQVINPARLGRAAPDEAQPDCAKAGPAARSGRVRWRQSGVGTVDDCHMKEQTPRCVSQT